MRSRLLRLATGLAVLGLGGGCDVTPSAGGGGCTPSATRVCMSGSQFVPPTLIVAPGVEVTWTNADGINHNHTVTSATSSTETFESGTKTDGETFRRTFNNLGTFRYFCRFHSAGGAAPTGMAGTITVK
jgi:plastocyanin